ncbi:MULTISPECIES: hypothetical protein [Haloferax]|uniref:Uncharacterized protein n=2 Tax=Haloferax TaxID=2251 RepID=A0A6G1Z127_9EURY|nr:MULTISPECIES: hypothetical protein [Haloferax]KAB1187566.1 hypothetical protein Hfx1149_05790 [Haloferax sp. CBA1149]MRW80222.1 hypothetical protein [Haloferax marinisediminis]
MNPNVAHNRRIDAVGRVLGRFVAVVALVLAAQFVVSSPAPIVAIPLLVASWIIGLGLAMFLPFTVVTVIAWVVA